MCKIRFRLFVALLTFVIGVLGVSFWIIKSKSLTESPREYPVQPIEKSSASIQSAEEIELANKPPVLPNPEIWTLEAQFSTKSNSDSWVPIYFEEIDKNTAKAKLSKLRSTALSKNDLEIRVWDGFGSFELQGFVLKQVNGQWSAIYLQGSRPQKLSEPRSGWEASFKRIVDAGIFKLPDASKINCDSVDPDGTSLVVEYKVNKIYRTYRYDDASYTKCSEAKQMSEIYKIMKEEFGF